MPRLVRLYLGLAGFGVSLALMVRARLGLGPWDVLHQGIARLLGVQLGWVTIGVSGLVLLTWIPLRQRPGLGTVSNAVIVGLVVNGGLDVLPAPGSLAWRAVWLAAGIGLNGVATACYIGAGLGPGPRDGLIDAAAEASGRRPDEIRSILNLSISIGPEAQPQQDAVTGSARQAISQLRHFLGLGFTGFNFLVGGPDQIATMERIAEEVLPALRSTG
jgi:uncharacterized membrane protein YczE